MALIQPVKVDTQTDAVKQALSSVVLYKWPNITENDECAILELDPFSDKSVHSAGTHGGSISFEGSLMPKEDTPEYTTLEDPNGDDLTFSDASTNKLKSVQAHVWKIRPTTPTSTGNTISAYLMAK